MGRLSPPAQSVPVALYRLAAFAGEPAPKKQETSKGGDEPAQKNKQETSKGGDEEAPKVVEDGKIYFLYRPKTGLKEAHNVAEVQRFYLVSANGFQLNGARFTVDRGESICFDCVCCETHHEGFSKGRLAKHSCIFAI